MKIIKTHYLSDPALGASAGREAILAEIETPSDLNELLSNIIKTGYYQLQYYKEKSGLIEGKLTLNLWFVATMVKALQPKKSLELGAGKGDTMFILNKLGVEAYGVDFSHDMHTQLDPKVRQHYFLGDVAEICQSLCENGQRFDTLVGLDIWEHLLPSKLPDYLRHALSVLSEDGYLFCIIPAFGRDANFGEQFPLEFEQNRRNFVADQPFRYLTLERQNPPIPCAGHLTWATSRWWEELFVSQGLVREKTLEERLHKIFDPLLPHSNKTFYIFRRKTKQAAHRNVILSKNLEAKHWLWYRWQNLAMLLYYTHVRRIYHWAAPPLGYIGHRLRYGKALFYILRSLYLYFNKRS